MDDSDRNDEAPQDGRREDQAGLEAALVARDAEVSELRRRLVEAPRRIHELEAAKRDGERELARARARNQKLSSTLESARERMTSLREEVEKLSQPPAAYGTVVTLNDDATADVHSGGRKMRVSVAPNLVGELQPGQEVVLNESMSVVLSRAPEVTGEVVTVKEVLGDSRRALVVGRADEERVVELAAGLRHRGLRSGDSVMVDPRSGLLLERLPRPEVEDLSLIHI